MDPSAALITAIAPMEAKLVSDLPEEPGWQFEPKWDGFRAIAVREGDAVTIWSKSGKPLGRYFPELVALVRACASRRFIVDGEIVVPVGDLLSFAALQARLHPAPSRIARLARETPAQLILFDLLHIDQEMVALRERFPDDKQRQQQAMMELYKKEKINPLSGCLPILIQIPVFSRSTP